jgi:ABC-type multidrug transport system fused ATPase/permease subunit
VAEALASLAGALGAYTVVAVFLLGRSPLLGATVLVGMPVMITCLSRVLRPLERTQSRHRALLGEVTALGADVAGGLRILRGLGGEQPVRRRYAALSRQVREAGVSVAGVRALLDAAGVLIPGLFLVFVLWFGAQLAVSGSLPPGYLLALYGCAAFLVQPISATAEAIGIWSAASVGARRLAVLLEAGGDAGAGSAGPPDPAFPLRRGEFTALPADPTRPAKQTARGIAATAGATVSGAVPYLFAGPLREVLDPEHRHSEQAVTAALHTAVAQDVVLGLADGLAARMAEAGRNLSGGQRQRIALARALLRRAETLVLIDPTSAVDAVTEATIATRLHAARAGHTTVVLDARPALVGLSDHVREDGSGDDAAYRG